MFEEKSKIETIILDFFNFINRIYYSYLAFLGQNVRKGKNIYSKDNRKIIVSPIVFFSLFYFVGCILMRYDSGVLENDTDFLSAKIDSIKKASIAEIIVQPIFMLFIIYVTTSLLDLLIKKRKKENHDLNNIFFFHSTYLIGTFFLIFGLFVNVLRYFQDNVSFIILFGVVLFIIVFTIISCIKLTKFIYKRYSILSIFLFVIVNVSLLGMTFVSPDITDIIKNGENNEQNVLPKKDTSRAYLLSLEKIEDDYLATICITNDSTENLIITRKEVGLSFHVTKKTTSKKGRNREQDHFEVSRVIWENDNAPVLVIPKNECAWIQVRFQADEEIIKKYTSKSKCDNDWIFRLKYYNNEAEFLWGSVSCKFNYVKNDE